MIDRTIFEDGLRHAVARARERGITIPTFTQMKDPGCVPDHIKEQLGRTGLWEVAPQNLFRIT